MISPECRLSASRADHSQVITPWAITCEWLWLAVGAVSLHLLSMGLPCSEPLLGLLHVIANGPIHKSEWGLILYSLLWQASSFCVTIAQSHLLRVLWLAMKHCHHQTQRSTKNSALYDRTARSIREKRRAPGPSRITPFSSTPKFNKHLTLAGKSATGKQTAIKKNWHGFYHFLLKAVLNSKILYCILCIKVIDSPLPNLPTPIP